MKVRYTRAASAELAAILDYIDERSPSGARNVKRRLQDIVTILAAHPYVGRLTKRPGIRRAVATPYPYLILYQVMGDGIVIHGFRHTARRPSED
ncbi:type II toxin-antitoxin system RelE/ParE family toxin [Azospirillum sp. B4]|uniref:type II toxin-antitoxin system RelE/ParE family toxin n=1 Tax=Azospirillum sp. B4 TaxID=95605 RepID=UPI0005C9454A|nr:type II toxin-antitoxin system RelE/ParE family toxin [Azospirillum sp. B4]